MRTTLTIDDDVAYGLKKAQEKNPRRTFKEIVNDLLRLGLRSDKPKAGKKEFKLITYPIGLRKDLNFDKIEDLLDEIEGPYRR